jgi:hypothetical protein
MIGEINKRSAGDQRTMGRVPKRIGAAGIAAEAE